MEGMYTFIAVQTGIYNNFRKQGSKPQKFPDKPIDEENKPRTDEEIRQELVDKLNLLKERYDAGTNHN